jgi:hypothetical protein
MIHTETIPSTRDHIVKAQYIRILDMVLIGPAMVMGGYLLRDKAPKLATVLAVSGLMTISFNGDNYYKNKKLLPP